MTGMVRNGYAEDFAKRCFDQIEGFGEYGFPESHAASFAHLVYISAWIKHYYPDVFCAALLNSQPMGFYAPAQLVRDAREHGVEVLHPDINRSAWDCTLEPVHDDEKERCAVRLGLRLVGGLQEELTRKTILEARGTGYSNIASLWLRSGAPISMLERLADADAFRSLELDRRAALWAVKGLDGGALHAKAARATSASSPLMAWSETADLFQESRVDLPATTLGEHVVEDYAAIGLSLKAHPIAFFRKQLARRGVIASNAHRDERLADRRVSVAGLVLLRQRPGTAKGVIFLTLEDEEGIVNVIVWPKVFENNRRVVMTSQFLLVRGKIERQGLVIHVVANALIDLTHELGALGAGQVAASKTATEPNEGSWTPKSRDFH
jgi:error-prone DNA polymerase